MRRGLVLVSATAIAVASTAAADAWAAAARPSSKLPGVRHVDVRGMKPFVRPAILDGTREVTVSLMLPGVPLAVQRANARRTGRAFDGARSHRAAARIAREQDRVAAAVRANGGTVTARIQTVADAVTVRIRASKVAALSRIPGVRSVVPSRTFTRANQTSNLYTGVPAAWDDLGARGDGVKIGVIDTGIDYYHKNFAGAGAGAFLADNSTIIEPGTFPTAKVAGGWDFVGDAYNANNPATTPAPDPDPLDCEGHGSHVAGTAAGDGVTGSGATYTGDYSAASLAATTWNVAPGVAPHATLYAYRVFGCTGTVDDAVIVAAIDRAVADGVDVVNLSLGSSYGDANSLETASIDSAALAGVTVVISSGNSGPGAYLTGSPGTADRALSVAALDARPGFAAASVDGTAITGQLSNDQGGKLPVTGTVRVLQSSPGVISLGCAASDYAAVQPGDVVVAKRGTCARVDRATLGQAAGAGAVILVNNATAFPPYEGPIAGVTIPFIGVSIADGPGLLAVDGTTHTVSPAGTIANPVYGQTADFSSAGPRSGDSAIKPEVSAPGVSVLSTAAGTGDQGIIESGTSMAAPHTAGIAALVKQTHPTWTPAQIKAAIINTATITTPRVNAYNLRLAGSGAVSARAAVDTVAAITTRNGLDTLSFGYSAGGGAMSIQRTITITNSARGSITYDLAAAFNGSARGATVKTSPSTVRVGGHSSESVDVTLQLSRAAAAALPTADVANGSVTTIRGAVTATPRTAGAGVYPLRVPFLVAPRATSDVSAEGGQATVGTDGLAHTTITLANHGIHDGNADVYGLGLTDPADTGGAEDIRAVGLQVLPFALDPAYDGDSTLIFAVNTWGRWSNAASHEVDIAVDTNGDGALDYVAFNYDLGAVLNGSPNGQTGTFIVDGAGHLLDLWLADAPTNGSTQLLVVSSSDFGLTTAASGFSYGAAAFAYDGRVDTVDGTAAGDAFAPTISTGDFVGLAPGDRTRLAETADPKAGLPGWLVVTLDDANGAAQGDIVRLRVER